MKNKKKLIKMLCSTLSIPALFAGNVSFAKNDPLVQVKLIQSENTKDVSKNFELTKEQAIEDINFMLDEIKKNHVSAVNGLPEELIKQKDLEIQNLPDRVSIVDEWRTLSRILCTLHDAHSVAFRPKCLCDLYFPFSFDKDFVCTSGEFKGYKMTGINDRSINDIYNEFTKHFSHEIDEWCHANFFCDYEFGTDVGNKSPVANLSRGGIDVFSPLKVKFQKGNEIVEKEITMLSANEMKSLGIGIKKVGWKSSDNWVSYKIDKENKIAILTLDACDLDEKYMNTVDDLFNGVNENGIKNIIVDIRNNPGGNSQVIDYFLTHVKFSNIKGMKCEIIKNGKREIYDHETVSFDNFINYAQQIVNRICKNTKRSVNFDKLFDGNLYVVTSNKTFSSGMLWASQMQDNKLAKIVGEVPGNSPTSYGDGTPHLKTPNSKIEFRTTWKKFYRADENANQKRVIPDVQVDSENAINKVYEIEDEKQNYKNFETEHFNVIYAKESEEKCKQILNDLENIYNKVTRDLKVSINKKTKIKLFKSKDDFHKSVGCYGFSEYNWVNGTAKDGFIKTHLDLSEDRLKEIVTHEFTHMATENINNGYIPFVFREGIATYEAGQSWEKESLKGVTTLPDDAGWLLKGQYPHSFSYGFAYSFVDFIIKNYGYDKIIEFLKVDYQNFKFNTNSIKDIYSEWKKSLEYDQIKFKSELLYNKLNPIINEFYKNPMLSMEDKCKEYMKSNDTVTFLDKNKFDEQSKGNLILYRGFDDKNAVNDFFNGKIYFSKNTNNMRGTGIYTSSSRGCAESYSTDQSTLAKMFISKEKSKILENDRLQSIKNEMRKNHPEDFSRFDGKDRKEFINDSAQSYLEGRFDKEVNLWAKEQNIEGSIEEIKRNLDENTLKEISKKIQDDSETQKVLSKREKFFEDPESFCWYNDGFLTFLLGYDVLHTNNYLRDFYDSKEDEYLVVNPKILNVLKNNNI